MKKILLKIIRYFLNKIIGINNYKKFLIFLSKLGNIDLLLLAYNNIGILNYQSETVSGEEFFIKDILITYLSNIEFPIIFDVGSNVGNYSKLINKHISHSIIYSFEPNLHTYNQLITDKSINMRCYNIGLGSNKESKKLYYYENEVLSSHASIYKDVLTDLHNVKEIKAIDFNISTLDEFCKDQNINKIDFLKIDTEGHELDVIKGAKNLLLSGKISIIQFEFNEMNIISRVFLKDFYELLKDYNFYRLNSHSLVPLNNYNSSNEIFKFQNIVVIRKGIKC